MPTCLQYALSFLLCPPAPFCSLPPAPLWPPHTRSTASGERGPSARPAPVAVSLGGRAAARGAHKAFANARCARGARRPSQPQRISASNQPPPPAASFGFGSFKSVTALSRDALPPFIISPRTYTHAQKREEKKASLFPPPTRPPLSSPPLGGLHWFAQAPPIVSRFWFHIRPSPPQGDSATRSGSGGPGAPNRRPPRLAPPLVCPWRPHHLKGNGHGSVPAGAPHGVSGRPTQKATRTHTHALFDARCGSPPPPLPRKYIRSHRPRLPGRAGLAAPALPSPSPLNPPLPPFCGPSQMRAFQF